MYVCVYICMCVSCLCMCTCIHFMYVSPTHMPYRQLVPVTQLYVSVDASTKDSLKRIDRPLFRDFWPRFLNSLEALSEKV